MSDLFSQLGIHWKLLVSQGVNFFILLGVLTFVAWRPLMKAVAERRKKIEQGLADAAAAEEKLAGISELEAERLALADAEATGIISDAKQEAGVQHDALIAEGEQKAEDILKQAALVAEQKRIEELERVAQEARELVRAALIRTVDLDPTIVDEKLIGSAVTAARKELSV